MFYPFNIYFAKYNSEWIQYLVKKMSKIVNINNNNNIHKKNNGFSSNTKEYLLLTFWVVTSWPYTDVSEGQYVNFLFPLTLWISKDNLVIWHIKVHDTIYSLGTDIYKGNNNF